MSVSINISRSFAQQVTVAGEVFNCECLHNDQGYLVDIFHNDGGDLFVESYEGDDLRSLEAYIANEVVPNLDTLIAESIARTEREIAKKRREVAEFWARVRASH